MAAESLAAYPPGIPNVLPGERLTAETLEYIQQALDHGGALRGASDRTLRTLRVAVEALSGSRRLGRRRTDGQTTSPPMTRSASLP